MAEHKDNQAFKNFIEFYNSLPINERYPLGKAFFEATGGKLSPHNNPLIVAIAMIRVQDDDGSIKLLGLKRGIPPFVGGIAFPGGFTETLESAHVAAARELKEELGLITNGEDFEVFGNSLMSPTNNDLFFFLHKEIFPKSILNDIVLSSESQAFVLIDENTEMCFSHHKAKSIAVLEREHKPTRKMNP